MKITEDQARLALKVYMDHDGECEESMQAALEAALEAALASIPDPEPLNAFAGGLLTPLQKRIADVDKRFSGQLAGCRALLTFTLSEEEQRELHNARRARLGASAYTTDVLVATIDRAQRALVPEQADPEPLSEGVRLYAEQVVANRAWFHADHNHNLATELLRRCPKPVPGSVSSYEKHHTAEPVPEQPPGGWTTADRETAFQATRAVDGRGLRVAVNAALDAVAYRLRHGSAEYSDTQVKAAVGASRAYILNRLGGLPGYDDVKARLDELVAALAEKNK